MAQQEIERRLVAILAADVFGYSRLMEADEEGTHVRLKSHREQLIDLLVEQHKGRIVKLTGDGALLEFPSVVQAVQCAIEIQCGIARRNADMPENQRIVFRIGVNLGDVIIEDDDVYGGGVNLAARLEALADPGGVCVSDVVYQIVRDRIGFAFEDLGEQRLKNIAEPVRAWQWTSDAPGLPPSTYAATVGAAPMDRPSIAVLPFDNVTRDPDQAYLSDGITDDLITALARIPWLFVIARNSSFLYKGRTVDVGRVRHELGVRYVLQGSVRRVDEQLRVTAQLVDAGTGQHLWGERYNALYRNVFELQDEIADRVFANTVPELTLAEIERARQKRPENLDAWDCYLRALPAMRQTTSEANKEAIGLLMQASELDPQFATAYARLSVCYGTAAYHGWEGAAADSIGRAFEFAQKAIVLDPQNAFAHDALASFQLLSGDLESAVSAATRALQLDPSLSAAYGTLINALAFLGRSNEAIEVYEKADRTSPRDPERSSRVMGLANALFAAARYEEVIEAAREHILLKPAWYGGYLLLAASLALLGRKIEAEAAGEQLLTLTPRLRLRGVRRRPMFRNAEVIQRMTEGLGQAGIPE